MKQVWLEDTIAYDGSQLSSEWAIAQLGQSGHAVITFRGAARVEAEHMVDLEDLANRDWIASEDMLHFIVLHPTFDLPLTIAYQHHLMCIMGECLRELCPTLQLARRGDDLMDGEHKLSVSIATTYSSGGIIHCGINISSANTPISTRGLNDYSINFKQFADRTMELYAADFATQQHAAKKVKAVS